MAFGAPTVRRQTAATYTTTFGYRSSSRRNILGGMADPLDGLTRSQLAAVTHGGGPLLVLGGAGTGKTHVLAHRFAWLAGEGTRPDAIAALTLTRGAADTLRTELDALVDPPYDELHVSAWEAFAERLLRDEAAEAGLDPAFATVTRADRVALLLERLDELSLRRHEIGGNPAPLLAGFVARIDRLKEEMIAPEQLVAHASRARELAEEEGDAARTRAARELEFARLYADHDRLLADRGALDRGDLVLRAFRLLHERPHVREQVAARYRHVLVDDYQDASFAHGMLLGLLCEERREVTRRRRRRPGDRALARSRAARSLRDFERDVRRRDRRPPRPEPALPAGRARRGDRGGGAGARADREGRERA